MSEDVSESLQRVLELGPGPYEMDCERVRRARDALADDGGGDRPGGVTRLALVWDAMVRGFGPGAERAWTTCKKNLSEMARAGCWKPLRLDHASPNDRAWVALAMAVHLALEKTVPLRDLSAAAQRKLPARVSTRTRDGEMTQLTKAIYDRLIADDEWEKAFWGLFSRCEGLAEDTSEALDGAISQLVAVLGTHPTAFAALRPRAGLPSGTPQEIAAWLIQDAVSTLRVLLDLDNRAVARQLACVAVPCTPQWANCVQAEDDTVPNRVHIDAVDPAHASFALGNLVGAIIRVYGTSHGLESAARVASPAATKADLRNTPELYIDALCPLLAESMQMSVRGIETSDAVDILRGALLELRTMGYQNRDFRYLVEDHGVGAYVARTLPELWVVMTRSPAAQDRRFALGRISMLLSRLFRPEATP